MDRSGEGDVLRSVQRLTGQSRGRGRPVERSRPSNG